MSVSAFLKLHEGSEDNTSQALKQALLACLKHGKGDDTLTLVKDVYLDLEEHIRAMMLGKKRLAKKTVQNYVSALRRALDSMETLRAEFSQQDLSKAEAQLSYAAAVISGVALKSQLHKDNRDDGESGGENDDADDDDDNDDEEEDLFMDHETAAELDTVNNMDVVDEQAADVEVQGAVHRKAAHNIGIVSRSIEEINDNVYAMHGMLQDRLRLELLVTELQDRLINTEKRLDAVGSRLDSVLKVINICRARVDHQVEKAESRQADTESTLQVVLMAWRLMMDIIVDPGPM